MWDEEDGFFYDVLRCPTAAPTRLKVRSMVGLLPLCAADGVRRASARRSSRSSCERARLVPAQTVPSCIATSTTRASPAYGGRRLALAPRRDKLRRVLAHMLDENEFLSPYGIRSLSRYHPSTPTLPRPAARTTGSATCRPSPTRGMFGGNSNWRGPIWMPVNALLIRALLSSTPTTATPSRSSARPARASMMNLFEVAKEIDRAPDQDLPARRRRAAARSTAARAKFQDDPHWRDYILFYEYFHGDNGAGIGASHQTGWTGLIASLIHYFSTVSAQ